jgi:DNA-binding NarL/FixJ family response regulator
MRVAIAEDSSLFREGLKLLLERDDIEVSAEAKDGTELLVRVDADPPDVCIIDLRMPPGYQQEGLDAARRLHARHPGVGVLILSTYDDTASAEQLFELGAGGRGYMLKDRVEDARALTDALTRLKAGESVIDSLIVDRLMNRSRRDDTLAPLTAREQDVLRAMAEGRSNAGIGGVLHLSSKTVENHVASIFTKLQIPAGADDNRRVLAVLASLTP